MPESAASNNHRPTGRVIHDLAKQGLFFAPTSKGKTRSDRTGWHEMATNDWSTLKGWVQEGLSLVSVAKRGHGFAIDIDDLAAVEAKGFRLHWLDGYYLVDTPSGGLHAHGLHDAKTNSFGSSVVVVYETKGDKSSKKIFELKLHNASVAAPTAWRIDQPKKRDGRYEPRGEEVADIRHGLCDGLLAWLTEHAEPQTKPVSGPKDWEFHEDHVMEDFLTHHHCVEQRQYESENTLWIVPEKCPLCGKVVLRTDTDLATRTKFSFSGRGWGFVCHACGVKTRAEFEEKLRQLHSGWRPWKRKIYVKKETDDFEWGEVEDAVDDLEEEAVAFGDAHRYHGDQVGTVADGEMKAIDPIANMSEKERKELATLSQNAKAYTADPRRESERLREAEEEPADKDEESEPREEANKILGEHTNADGHTTSLLVRRASDYEMVQLKWLWDQKIPLGKATLFTGMPDCCKSLCLIDLVSRVTKGEKFPDGAPNDLGPSEVLIAATEDDPQDTIVPRLCAAGADLSKVQILKGVLKKPKDKPRSKKAERLSLKRDVKLLLDALKANPKIKFLVLDPITGFFGDADANKDSDIRPMLEDIQKMLSMSGVTMVGIIHSNKRSDVDAIGKVSGAGAIAAVVRATWQFSRDKEDKSLYHMSFVKGNLGKVKSGMDYTVTESPVLIEGKVVGVPRVVWGDANDKDANDLMEEARHNRDEKDTKSIMAKTLIETMIPAKLKDIYAKGEEEGISEETVKRAKRKIVGLIHKQFNKEWWAYMPDKLPFWAKAEDADSETIPDMPA